jgi:hypothetical protein
VVIYDRRYGCGVRRQGFLKIIGLNVLRAEVERVAGFLVKGSQVEELGNAFAATGSQVCVLLLKRVNAIKEVLRALLEGLEVGVFLFQGGEPHGLFALRNL